MSKPRLTPDERRYVAWFRTGMRMDEIAYAHQVPLVRVERAIRKALTQIAIRKALTQIVWQS